MNKELDFGNGLVIVDFPRGKTIELCWQTRSSNYNICNDKFYIFSFCLVYFNM